jgi:hypothetical protein
MSKRRARAPARPVAAVVPPAPRPRCGRRCLPDPRRITLRLYVNREELLKFRILSSLNQGVSISAMSRDIIIDELNASLSDWPRNELIAELQTHGLDDGAIESLLKSI